jgi:hypothetical protein
VKEKPSLNLFKMFKFQTGKSKLIQTSYKTPYGDGINEEEEVPRGV